MKIEKAIALSAGMLMTITLSAAAAGPFEIGQPLADLTLPDAEDGRPRSLAQFRGRPLVLHVFASW